MRRFLACAVDSPLVKMLGMYYNIASYPKFSLRTRVYYSETGYRTRWTTAAVLRRSGEYGTTHVRRRKAYRA